MLVKSLDECIDLGICARNRIVEKFSMDSVKIEYKNLYKKINI